MEQELLHGLKIKKAVGGLPTALIALFYLEEFSSPRADVWYKNNTKNKRSQKIGACQ